MEKLHFMNYIWSDCILVESEGLYALVDTGEVNHLNKTLAYLDYLGVKNLEFVYVSHFHYDHYSGSEAILKTYNVKKFFIQEYSGCDGDDGSGNKQPGLDDEYHFDANYQFKKILELAKKKCEVAEIVSDNTTGIECGKFKFKAFRTRNYVRQAYEDKDAYCYHQCLLSENGNSSPLYANVNGKNIFLGSDIADYDAGIEYLSYVNLKIAKELGCQMDIYKVPHHGTSGCNTKEALAIYKPKHAIITNSYWYLERWTTIKDLMEANKDCKTLTTERKYLIYTIPVDGDIKVDMISYDELYNRK
ncbi:MAG: MBL fold metallo-hydrolase [Bacilli bacterium]|nr:MBL fold metallo-hydrolase [Bacilli bacterium]